MSKSQVTDTIAFHTIKKLELIERYINGWARKLISNQFCKKLVFIDCMCNSGEYMDQNGERVRGTALRVCEILQQVARDHPEKTVAVYLNDIDPKKIEALQQKLPYKTSNFLVYTPISVTLMIF